MAESTTWAELSSSERDQLSLVFISLKEFSYGLDRLREVSTVSEPGVAIVRFYMNSLHHYFASYFLVGGAHKLRNTLENIGNQDLLQPIDELLDLKVGAITVREVIKTWRNKALVHQAFDMKLLQKHILSPAELHKPEAGAQLSLIVSALFQNTQALYVELASRYPEAIIFDSEGEEPQLLKRRPEEYPDWEKYNPPNGQKQAGRHRTDILICENPACPSEGRLISEHESFYLFATQTIFQRVLGFGSLYKCPFCHGKRLQPLLKGTW